MNPNDNENLDLDLELEEQNNDKNNQQSNANSVGVEQMINCPKCGRPMKISARCCMHCGELNQLNSKNDSVKPSFDLGKKLKMKEEKANARKSLKNSINNFQDQNGVTREEKKYSGMRKVIDLVIIIIIILAAINYKIIINSIDTFRAKHYLQQVDKIVEQFDAKVKDNQCSIDSSNSNNLFAFQTSEDYFKTSMSFYTFDYFEGYIELKDNGNGQYDYYITITDGKYGFKNVLYSKDLDISIIKKLSTIELPNGSINC